MEIVLKIPLPALCKLTINFKTCCLQFEEKLLLYSQEDGLHGHGVSPDDVPEEADVSMRRIVALVVLAGLLACVPAAGEAELPTLDVAIVLSSWTLMPEDMPFFAEAAAEV